MGSPSSRRPGARCSRRCWPLVAGEAAHGPATEFELLTAAAYLWAARQAVDIVVMEVGLGGRLDASNTWDPDVARSRMSASTIRSTSATRGSIAAEKAQIIKPGSRAVTGASGVALEVIEAHARRCTSPSCGASPLPVARSDQRGLEMQHPQFGRLELPLLGRHQASNTAVALGVLDALAARGLVTPRRGRDPRGIRCHTVAGPPRVA